MEAPKRWLNQYPKSINPTLPVTENHVGEFLIKSATDYPKQIAIEYFGKRISYATLLNEVFALHHQLQLLELHKGQRVAVMLPNCPQYVIAYYAILFSEAVVVPINPLLTGREIQSLLQDCDASIMIVVDRLFPKIARIQHRTVLQHVIVTGLETYMPVWKRWMYQTFKTDIRIHFAQHTHLHSWPEAQHSKDSHGLSNRIPSFLSRCKRDTNDLAVLQYTSGTTGKPKGVQLTHRNLIANVRQCIAWYPYARYGQERVVGVLPFFHAYGMTAAMNVSVALASTLLILPRFERSTLTSLLAKASPTLFPTIPTILSAIVPGKELPERVAFPTLRMTISGASPLCNTTKHRFKRLAAGEIIEGYGLSEASPVTHAQVAGKNHPPGSIGIPWPDTEAQIVDTETEAVQPPGEVGEIWVKGPQVMKGYWRDDVRTAQALCNGWLKTGDIGYMDSDGNFFVLDRKDDRFIRGGYNIYPREIEAVLMQHPAVQECAVCPGADTYWGNAIFAFVVIGHSLMNNQQLRDWCRLHLAAYKIPDRFIYCRQLPRTSLGKVEKYRLKVEHDLKQNMTHNDRFIGGEEMGESRKRNDTE